VVDWPDFHNVWLAFAKCLQPSHLSFSFSDHLAGIAGIAGVLLAMG